MIWIVVAFFAGAAATWTFGKLLIRYGMTRPLMVDVFGRMTYDELTRVLELLDRELARRAP
jgi:hypothetical protein